MNIRNLAFPLCAALALGACGDDGHHEEEFDCTMELRADEYTAGLTKYGSGELRVVLVEAIPAPPAKGDNEWRLRVENERGEPVSGLDIEVKPTMPDHGGHDTPIVAVVTPLESPGEYTAAPVNLWMSGLWDVTVELSAEDEPLDSIAFHFCIDG